MVQSLYRDIAVPYPDMTLIKVVPNVAKVFSEALLLKLCEVIDCWIDQRETHKCKQEHTILEASVNIDLIYKNTKN